MDQYYIDTPANTNCTDVNDGSTCTPQWGPNSAAWQNDYAEVTEAISDNPCSAAGCDAYISLPEDNDYNLHVLTYVSGAFDAVNDTFA